MNVSANLKIADGSRSIDRLVTVSQLEQQDSPSIAVLRLGVGRTSE